MKTVQVDLLDRNTNSVIRAEFEYDTERLFVLTLHIPGKQAISANERDYFESFCKIRRQLEPQGLIPLCIGARRDVYPTGMSRQMGGGLRADIHKMNIRSSANDPVDLVYIFAPAPRELVTTVAEQRDYFKDWVESVTGQRPAE